MYTVYLFEYYTIRKLKLSNADDYYSLLLGIGG